MSTSQENKCIVPPNKPPRANKEPTSTVIPTESSKTNSSLSRKISPTIKIPSHNEPHWRADEIKYY